MIPLFVMVALATPPESPSAWPGFRGAGDGVSAAGGLPVRWSESENLAWKADLPGYGQSSPVVWRDRVYVTAVEGEQRDRGHVLAYDARTGAKAWAHAFEPTQKAKWGFSISRAAPTPVADAEGVYAFFEGGNLIALTHEGKERWSRSLVKDYGEFKNGHGLGSSPAQTGDAVIVLIDHQGPSYLLAVDKKTGKTLWKTDRKERSSWTSPVVVEQGGRAEVVVSSNGDVTSYDAATGKQLRHEGGLQGNTIPSAARAGELVLIGAGLSERGGDPEKAARSNACLKLTTKEGKAAFEWVWRAEKAVCSYASPLAYRGHAYFVNSAGVVHCLDLRTGEEKYTRRIDGNCWASPVGANGHVYFFTRQGVTTVLAAGPEYRRVASNRLWEEKPGEKKDAPAPEGKRPEGKRPEGKGPAGKGPEGKGPGAGAFGSLDTVVHGVAVGEGAFFIRTGTALYRVGKPTP